MDVIIEGGRGEVNRVENDEYSVPRWYFRFYLPPCTEVCWDNFNLFERRASRPFRVGSLVSRFVLRASVLRSKIIRRCMFRGLFAEGLRIDVISEPS